MEIKSKLKLVGADVVDSQALMVNDDGEEYPIFLEALHNEFFFHLMIESGYELREYPYGFVKNGVSIMDIAEEEFVPDTATLQSMYDAIGVKLPYDEIIKHIKAPKYTVPIPDTNYTIFTREEFLKYLDCVSTVSTDDDYLPINYFVAPEARFTMEEYLNTDNAIYVNILSERRKMSLTKFYRLVEWLQQNGLGASYDQFDVVHAYFAWGLDGLNAEFLDKEVKTSKFPLSNSTGSSLTILKSTLGFVDSDANMLIPDHMKNHIWKWGSSSQSYVNSIVKDVKPGCVNPCTFYADSMTNVCTMRTANGALVYSADDVFLRNRAMPSIRVYSPIDAGTTISLEHALPCNSDSLRRHLILLAMANLILNRRKVNMRAASYDVYTLMGLDPAGIIRHVSRYFDRSKTDDEAGLNDDKPLSDMDVDTILAGVQDESMQRKIDDVMSIINGDTNIGRIAEAQFLEAACSPESIYNILYGVHYVFGVSLEDIAEKVRTAAVGETPIVFEHDGLKAEVPMNKIDYTKNAYNLDIQENDLAAAESCKVFYMVRKVAREMGNEKCRRHVAFDGLRVIRTDEVNAMLDELKTHYEKLCNTSIADAHSRAEMLSRKHSFALFAFFEAALKGVVSFPPTLGAPQMKIEPARVMNYMKHVKPVIDSTLAYCIRQYNGSDSEKIDYHAYCVNAYITPEYVIPRIGQSIPEFQFYALWQDWRKHPALYEALINNKVVTPDFVPWTQRYTTDGFQRSLSAVNNDADSLKNYYDASVEYIENFVPGTPWSSVPHMLENLYPMFAKMREDEVSDIADVNAQQATVRLGVTRTITFNDYADLFGIQPAALPERQYIKRFKGFGVDELLLCKDVVSLIPDPSKKPFMVHASSGSIAAVDGSEKPSFVDFRRIDEFSSDFAVVNVYGGKYVIRDIYGKLWEVMI